MARKVTAVDKKMLVATLPADANLSEWCRRLGISRQTAYKWRRRFAADGAEGLADRSTAPKEAHGRSAPELEDAAVRKRKELLEQGWDHGPASVADRLRLEGIVVSDATVWRILSRRGQIVPQPEKRPRSSWLSFERARPNELWQGDDTHAFLADGSEVRIINMVDDHSRLNVHSLAARECTSTRIWECFSVAASRHGLPQEFLDDNGRAWISPAGFAPTRFSKNLALAGVHQIHSSPYHPQTCGKVERFHFTQRQWLDARPRARDVEELQRLVDEFRADYNEQRTHKSIGRRTPASVWAAQEPATPPHTALARPPTFTLANVDAHARVRTGKTIRIAVEREHRGKAVALIRTGDDIVIIDAVSGEILRELTVEPARDYYGTGRRPRRAKPADV
jgi:transposase InsO family protein